MRNRELRRFPHKWKNHRIDKPSWFCLHRAVKWLELMFLIVLVGMTSSCTTLVNRRDLYSPEPAPDSLEAARQWYGTTTTSTTMTTRTRRPSAEVLPPPDVPNTKPGKLVTAVFSRKAGLP